MKLLVLLLGMLVLAPLLEQFFHLLLLEDLFLTAVFIYAAYSISRNRLLLVTAIGLAMPAIASTWLRPFVKAQWFGIFGGLCDVAFIAAITVAILVYTFRQKDISADVIAGAIVAYLLMAVMWSQIYVVLETTQPGSFNFPAEVRESQQSLLRYFKPGNHHNGRLWGHHAGDPCCPGLRQSGVCCRSTLPGDPSRLAGRNACFHEIQMILARMIPVTALLASSHIKFISVFSCKRFLFFFR
jgi:hypothetical protein